MNVYLLMARANCYRQVLFVFAALLVAGQASGFGLHLHHRFSPVVRRWAEARSKNPDLAGHWPAQGSPEYYSALSRHDRARRGLACAAANGLLAFADGNITYNIQDLGFLYYAEVAVGTPSTTFMVPLDTGSDLFWVPCECKQCANVSSNGAAPGAPRPRPSRYSPRLSSTSKPVTCDNALCDHRPNACGAATNGSCPYRRAYVSANTSSSGVLVQDVLHLTREGPGPGAAAGTLQAPIVFGCGQVQTGSFLDGSAAPDGLLGLSRDKVSVPSLLASSGLVASNSFSMCFGDDGTGRINFGDAGSRDQAETPFIVSPSYYNVSFTSINVGSKSAPVEFTAIMDSGTSFTSLNDPEYTELATNFNSQIREKRANFSKDSVIYEYCYELRPNQTDLVLIPDVSLTTKGGALFPVTDPTVVMTLSVNGQDRTISCLGITKNDDTFGINIIGQNFMTGLKVVFDRERSVLGWHKFDCYKNARKADTPDDGSPSAAVVAETTLKPQQKDANYRYPGVTAAASQAAGTH